MGSTPMGNSGPVDVGYHDGRGWRESNLLRFSWLGVGVMGKTVTECVTPVDLAHDGNMAWDGSSRIYSAAGLCIMGIYSLDILHIG